MLRKSKVYRQVRETELGHHDTINAPLNTKIFRHLLLCPLQLPVQPAVLLFLDEQADDVTVVEAEECVVVARRVGKDGNDPGLPDHVQARRLGC